MTTTITSFTVKDPSGTSVNGATLLYGTPLTMVPVFTNATSSNISVPTWQLFPSLVSGNTYTTVAEWTTGTNPGSPITLTVVGTPVVTSSVSFTLLAPSVRAYPPSTSTTYVTIGGSVNVSASITNFYSPVLTWHLSGVGSLSSYSSSPTVFSAGMTPGFANINPTYANSVIGCGYTAYVLIQVVDVPHAISVTPSYSYVTDGATVTLTPNFTGGTATLTGSGISTAVTSGTPYTFTPGSDATNYYTLTVTNLAGATSVNDSTYVITVPAPSIDYFTASYYTIPLGGSTTLSWSLENASNWSITYLGSPGGGNISVSPTSTTTYTLTATNYAGTSVTSSVTITVNPTPSISSFSISSSSPLYGDSVTLTPVFSNGTGEIGWSGNGSSDITSSASSGVGIATTPLVPRTYTLSVVNLGTYVYATVSVTPQTVSISSISPTTPIGTGQPRNFSATVSGALNSGISWSNTGVAGSWSGSTFTPSAAGTLYITATSIANPSISVTTPAITVVDPPTVSLSATSTNPLRGSTNITITPTHNGVSAVVGTTQGANDISSSATNSVAIPVQSGGFTTSTTYWLRAYNSAGIYSDTSITVTVQTVSVIVTGISNLLQGGSSAFTATVSGAVNLAVTWSVDGGSPFGTFSGNTFTPPTSLSTFTAPTGASVASFSTLRATAVADGTKSGSKVVTIQTVAVPSVTPATVTMATSATQTFTATVTGATNTGVTWSIYSGSGSINSSGVFTAPRTAGTTYITATSISDPSKSNSTAVATIVPNPTIASFTSSVSSPLVGQSYTITPVYVNGTGVIDHSVGSLASGVPSSAIIAGTSSITYLLTVSSSVYGTTPATATLTVAPQTVAVSISPSSVSINGSVSQQFSATVSGAVNPNVTWSIDGDNTHGTVTADGLYTSPSASPIGGTATLRATSIADPSKSATSLITITVVNIALGQSTASVTTATTFSTIATVTGTSNTDVVWSVIGPGTISGSVYTAPSSPGSAILRATSVADPTKHTDCAITIVAAPSISSFTPSTLTPLYNSSATLTPIFTNGVGSIDNGIGIVASGVTYSTPALNSPTSFTLTVTNSAGTSVHSTVNLIPTSLSITVNPSTYIAIVNQTITFTAIVLLAGSGSTGKTWSATGGSINSITGVWTAPATATPPGVPIVITATAVADTSKTSNCLVTVVYPIYSGKKSATASSSC